MCSCSGSCNCNSTTIPRGPAGPQGPSGSISVGEVTSLPFGSEPTVTNSGTTSSAIFNFGIPQGEPGDGTPGGYIISDVIPSSVPFGVEDGPELLVPTSAMTSNGSTTEIEIYASTTGATGINIVNVGSGITVFGPIALPVEDLQYRFSVTISLVRNGTALQGIARVIGARVNDVGTDIVIENVTLSAVNFTTDQTYRFVFADASGSDDTLFATVKLFNPII
jgi:hypothetical protein